MTNFETYRKELADSILSAKDFQELDDKLFEASCDLGGYQTHEISDEAMAAIMRKSQSDVEAGRIYSMDDMEAFMNSKVYELTHRMDSHCAAEP
ncbi:MAG: hypothetical protein II949_13015 [Prevotella sp.]|nr:hypothetical protein [Prevotella sp.]